MKTNESNHKASIDARTPRLGVDIGRVIIAGDGPDTSFIGGSDQDALSAPALPGAVESLTRLAARFEGRLWLVSKCGARIEGRTRAWLARHRCFEITGIPRANLIFCRSRPEKAPICARLGIDCFVDDRWDVLGSMAGIVAHRLLFGAQTTPDLGVLPVLGWREAEAAILTAFPAASSSALFTQDIG